jgi:hypothetical protein
MRRIRIVVLTTVLGSTWGATAVPAQSSSQIGDSEVQMGVPLDGEVPGYAPLDTEPKAFGADLQNTVFSAAAMIPYGGTTRAGAGTDGYIYPLDVGADYWSQIMLPQGALIVSVCVFVYDNTAGGSWQTQLLGFELFGNGPNTTQLGVMNTGGGPTPGYTELCMSPNVTFRSYADLNGDGSPSYCSFNVFAISSGVANENLQLGGYRVLWQRQVSAAPASATFGDVPTTHSFFRFVEALADAGITGGCGGGNYCPNSPLTRGQMAVFLSTALGLHWPN